MRKEGGWGRERACAHANTLETAILSKFDLSRFGWKCDVVKLGDFFFFSFISLLLRKSFDLDIHSKACMPFKMHDSIISDANQIWCGICDVNEITENCNTSRTLHSVLETWFGKFGEKQQQRDQQGEEQKKNQFS